MYALNPTAAREADRFNKFLSETGKYKGKFTRAEKLISSAKSTHGIGFTFETDDKQSTRFDIWTMNKDNEPLMGFKTLNAIMACMKVKNISPAPGQVDRWDSAAGGMIKVGAEVFPELMNKPIGMVLVNTEYEKQRNGQKTGEYGWRLEPLAPFEAGTEFTASEIMDQATQPKKLASVVATLADRPVKSKAARPTGGDSIPTGHPAAGGFSTPEDEDIPF